MTKSPVSWKFVTSIATHIAIVMLALAIPSMALAEEQAHSGADGLRPPAVPLIVHDPYFSVWSMSDRITDQATRHWTGKANRLSVLARIDGTTYRVVGDEPRGIAPLHQDKVEVLPTRTIYKMSGAGTTIVLTFLTPTLPGNLEVLSRPLTYIVLDAASTDGKTHRCEFYLDAAADLAVNTPDQSVVWSRINLEGGPALRLGTQEQRVLAKPGDDLRIDWGYLYLAADKQEGVSQAILDRRQAKDAFIKAGQLPSADDDRGPVPAGNAPGLAYSVDFGGVTKHVSRYLMVAYDDEYSVEYFERRLRPLWRKRDMSAAVLLQTARREYEELAQKSRALDDELMADMTRAGGEKYARLGALSYRQAFGAHKAVVDMDGTVLYFSKENFSNGCIGTVDVFYPSAPLLLLFNPRLLEAQMRPIMDYANSGRWRFPFAPHDLGKYPLANGQVYGGGERTEEDQMPVEETGNMLILMAALAQVDGNAAFAEKYWPTVSRWAEYLTEKGLDPENQLSTDDFAGHLAHNANLSLKAILALGAYSKLSDMTGHHREAEQYRNTAQKFATQWAKLAQDGEHYKLAFDQPGWSQKYNLVWDRLLGLNLFPAEVARKELACYKSKQNTYGLPLDQRRDYTKLDWEVWTATLTDSKADFQTFIDPIYRWMNETNSRVPLTDWYSTTSGKQEGFQARSVVGGVFIKMLSDPSVWKKWSQRSRQ